MHIHPSKCLNNIAEKGGPRCCKRDSLIAIETASEFIRELLDMKMEEEADPVCSYSSLNKECLQSACDFFQH